MKFKIAVVSVALVFLAGCATGPFQPKDDATEQALIAFAVSLSGNSAIIGCSELNSSERAIALETATETRKLIENQDLTTLLANLNRLEQLNNPYVMVMIRSIQDAFSNVFVEQTPEEKAALRDKWYVKLVDTAAAGCITGVNMKNAQVAAKEAKKAAEAPPVDLLNGAVPSDPNSPVQ